MASRGRGRRGRPRGTGQAPPVFDQQAFAEAVGIAAAAIAQAWVLVKRPPTFGSTSSSNG